MGQIISTMRFSKRADWPVWCLARNRRYKALIREKEAYSWIITMLARGRARERREENNEDDMGGERKKRKLFEDKVIEVLGGGDNIPAPPASEEKPSTW